MLRGRLTRMCYFRLTSASHSKYHAQQITFNSVSLRFRENRPPIKFKDNII